MLACLLLTALGVAGGFLATRPLCSEGSGRHCSEGSGRLCSTSLPLCPPLLSPHLPHLTRAPLSWIVASAADHYGVLGVSRGATAAEVKRAYRRLALKNHPDVNKAPDAQDKFARIAEAYSVLSDGAQRAEYDRRRGSGAAGGGGGAYGRSSTSSRGSSSTTSRSSAGASAAARAARERSREKQREEEDLAAGDSFGALFSDLASTLLGSNQGWLELLEGMTYSEVGRPNKSKSPTQTYSYSNLFFMRCDTLPHSSLLCITVCFDHRLFFSEFAE